MTTLDDLRRRRPGNRARIDAIKDEMDREVCCSTVSARTARRRWLHTNLLAAAIGCRTKPRFSDGARQPGAVAASTPFAGIVEVPAVSWKLR